MLDLRSKQILGTVTLVAVAAVTLVVAPYTLLDPMGLPKLSVLAFFAVVALSIMVPVIKSLFSSGYMAVVILLSLFIVQIILVLLFSGANVGAQFYGTYTRNTGALAYISLALLLMSSSLVSDKQFLKKFTGTTLITGAILIVYGNIQYLGLEPFPYANAYTVNAPIGTFGNSNFQAAFMGLIAVIASTMVLNPRFKMLTRLGLGLMGLAAIVVVRETLSSQGYLNFIAGAGVVVMLWLFMSKRKVLAIVVAGLGVISGGLVFLGLINSGPLAKYIYEASIAAREYYWRAGIKMLIEHPIFGVGMDNYGSWYGRNRQVAMENGFSTHSNSAHNVYLDIASNGGFPLLVIYLAITALVVVAIVRVIQRNEGFDAYFLATVGAWFAYHVQSFISINQLGLAMWGWVLSGVIIGYEINTRPSETSQSVPIKRKHKSNKVKSSAQPLSSKAVISVFAGVILGALVAIPPYYANASLFSALKSGDIKKIQSAAYLKPIDERRLIQVAGILLNNKYEAETITMARDANARYPDSYDLWNLWSAIPTASPADLATAKAQLKRLDPFNPNLK